MTSISEFLNHMNRDVRGCYRMVSIERIVCDERSQPRTRIVIADASGLGLCGGRTEACQFPDAGLTKNALVHLQGRVTTSPRGRVYIRAQSCVPVATVDRPSWQLLPRCWAPKTALPAFDRLLALLDRLDNAPLRAFMDQLFADTSIAEPYVRLPGSRSHHHAYPGGLLRHSVECAEAAEQLAPRFLADHEVALAIVGALLHDIAKIRILAAPHSGQHPIHGVTQEALNLEVLAPFFAALDAAWPTGGAALREMLAPARRSGPAGGWAPLLLTDFIRYIDRLSAGADLRHNRFRQLPVTQRCTRTEHGQLLARVLPPVPARHAISIEALI